VGLERVRGLVGGKAQGNHDDADMFLLPSGPSARIEGQVKEHPIILEGYKKEDFICLLKVMYPTYVLLLVLYYDSPKKSFYLGNVFIRARSLISGSTIHLDLTKEEWVSVLKLSTIWNMNKVGLKIRSSSKYQSD
jgi:hypothetical protein